MNSVKTCRFIYLYVYLHRFLNVEIFSKNRSVYIILILIRRRYHFTGLCIKLFVFLLDISYREIRNTRNTRTSLINNNYTKTETPGSPRTYCLNNLFEQVFSFLLTTAKL